MQGTDHSIVRAVLAGDKEAYGALVRAHSAALFRVAFRIVGNEAEAEEIVQEAFLRGYQQLESFQQRSSFGTWIYRIAVNCALNRISQPSIDADYRHGDESDPEHKTVQVATQQANPEQVLLSLEMSAARELAMLRLTPTEKSALCCGISKIVPRMRLPMRSESPPMQRSKRCFAQCRSCGGNWRRCGQTREAPGRRRVY